MANAQHITKGLVFGKGQMAHYGFRIGTSNSCGTQNKREAGY